MRGIWLEVGKEGAVAIGRVVALGPWRSAPLKRLVREAEAQGRVLDLTGGQARQSVIVLDSGHVVVSAREVGELQTASSE